MTRYPYNPRPVWGPSMFQSMVAKIVAANVVVFLLQNMIPAINYFFALTPRFVVERLFVWQLFSYMFLHGGFMHLFFNMLMLWIFGSTIESVWGPKQFLRYYVFCGIGGAVASLVFNYNAHVVGASGAIFGLYLAYAMMFPNNLIYLYFMFPVKAKYLVMGLAVIQLANGLSGPTGIAYFAHLGGMAAGLVFFRAQVLRHLRFTSGAKRRWGAYQNQRRNDDQEREQDNVNSILDKISEKGVRNLSSTERRILENYRKRHGGDSS